MAGLIQRAVAALYVKDEDTSRVRDNIITALNPVLTFLVNNFAQDNPILTFLRDVKGKSAVFTGNVRSASLDTGPITAAASRFSGDMVVNGNAAFRSRTANGFVITPAAPGTALAVTNTAGTVNGLVVTDTGAVTALGTSTAPSFVSGQGFCDTVPVGEHYNTNFAASNLVPLTRLVMNVGGLGGVINVPYMRKVPRACSVVGFTLSNSGSNTGNHFLMIYRNNQIAYTWAPGSGANNATFWGTQPKGSIPFAAGDTLNCSYACSSAGNVQIVAHLTLEMSA